MEFSKNHRIFPKFSPFFRCCQSSSFFRCSPAFSGALLFFSVFLLDPIRSSSGFSRIIRKLSRFSLRCSMLSWPLRPHSGMIELQKSKPLISRRYKTTMKTSNYFAKLPQEASIKSIQTFRDYDLITLNLPAPRQRLCPRCGSINCVIKDSGAWQTVRHLPSHHRGTAVAFHKRRLFCKECPTSFYENPYWVHPSLHMTQALYDSILLDLTEPLSFSESYSSEILFP